MNVNFDMDLFATFQETIGNMARNLRALVTKNSMKERFRTAQTYLQKLKFLVEDVGVFTIDLFNEKKNF